MDPVLFGITVGTLLTSSLVLWQRGNSKRSQTRAEKITIDTTTNSDSEMEKR